MSLVDAHRQPPLPDSVKGFMEIGLETGLQQDRVEALQVANRIDALSSGTKYGEQVVAEYMKQADLKLDENQGRGYGHANRILPIEAGRIQLEVVRAMSGAIGVSAVYRQALDYDQETRQSVWADLDQNVTVLGINRTKQLRMFDPGFTNDCWFVSISSFRFKTSNTNLTKAVRAVRGLGVAE